MPQARFWIAIARLNSARGQPNSAAIGIWNTPKLARIEKPSIRMIAPPINTGVIRRALFIGNLGLRGAQRTTCRRAGSMAHL